MSIPVEQPSSMRATRSSDWSPPGQRHTAGSASSNIVAHDDRSFSLGLGALRGIAALGVLVFHVFLALPFAGLEEPHLERFDFDNAALLAQHLFLGVFNGRALVVLFFVLSGCVLAMSLDRAGHFGLRDLPGYWVKRGFRLYPLLVFAATLGALLQTQVEAEPFPSTSTWADWHYKLATEDIPREWVRNAVGLSNTLNSPAWSIRVELLASLMFPALYWLSKSGKLALVTTAVLMLAMFLPKSLTVGWYDMNIYAFSFYAGALVPRYGAAGARWYARLPGSWRALALAGVILVFMFGRRVIYPGEFVSPRVVLVESLCATVIVAIVMFRPTPRLFASSVVQGLGQISYGVYLLHLIVLFAFIHAFLKEVPPLGTGEAVLVAVALCAATLAITLPLSAALHTLLEQPMQQLGSRIARRLTRH